jgi:hypothetical protein
MRLLHLQGQQERLCAILKKEEAQAARAAINRIEFKDKHLRVDLDIHEQNGE